MRTTLIRRTMSVGEIFQYGQTHTHLFFPFPSNSLFFTNFNSQPHQNFYKKEIKLKCLMEISHTWYNNCSNIYFFLFFSLLARYTLRQIRRLILKIFKSPGKNIQVYEEAITNISHHQFSSQISIYNILKKLGSKVIQFYSLTVQIDNECCVILGCELVLIPR